MSGATSPQDHHCASEPSRAVASRAGRQPGSANTSPTAVQRHDRERGDGRGRRFHWRASFNPLEILETQDHIPIRRNCWRWRSRPHCRLHSTAAPTTVLQRQSAIRRFPRRRRLIEVLVREHALSVDEDPDFAAPSDRGFLRLAPARRDRGLEPGQRAGRPRGRQSVHAADVDQSAALGGQRRATPSRLWQIRRVARCRPQAVNRRELPLPDETFVGRRGSAEGSPPAPRRRPGSR